MEKPPYLVLNQFVQFRIICFAGAEDWEFFEHFNFSGGGEVGQTGGGDGFADFAQLERGFIGGGDELLAFVGIWSGDDSNHAVFAVLWERTGQCPLHGS